MGSQDDGVHAYSVLIQSTPYRLRRFAILGNDGLVEPSLGAVWAVLARVACLCTWICACGR